MNNSYEIYDNGDSALSIYFKSKISKNLSMKIIQLAHQIKLELTPPVTEIIPAYQSLTLIYNSLKISNHEIKQRLNKIITSPLPELTTRSKLITIPVCYEGQLAADLEYLSEYTQLSPKQIIQMHTAPTYRVQMLGFLPGFLYLTGLDKKLYCPRKNTPSITIPTGSVAIGGEQTGIYPIASPGGWQLIGTTPLKLFNPKVQQPFIASPLDQVKFVSISTAEFRKLQADPL